MLKLVKGKGFNASSEEISHVITILDTMVFTIHHSGGICPIVIRVNYTKDTDDYRFIESVYISISDNENHHWGFDDHAEQTPCKFGKFVRDAVRDEFIEETGVEQIKLAKVIQETIFNYCEEQEIDGSDLLSPRN